MSKPYPQWVIVENAGTNDESIWDDYYQYDDALIEFNNMDSEGFDIMKRLPDGTLTTEY